VTLKIGVMALKIAITAISNILKDIKIKKKSYSAENIAVLLNL